VLMSEHFASFLVFVILHVAMAMAYIKVSNMWYQNAWVIACWRPFLHSCLHGVLPLQKLRLHLLEPC
jgi:hypothetical protein